MMKAKRVLVAPVVCGILSTMMLTSVYGAENCITEGMDSIQVENSDGENFSVRYDKDLNVLVDYKNENNEEVVTITHTNMLYDNSSEFEYVLDVPEGGYLMYVESEEDENDQSILIYDGKDILIGYTENILPDGIDDVKVRTILEGNKIIQTYKSKNLQRMSTDEISASGVAEGGITVTATSQNSFSTYFTKAEWITRSGMVSLSLYRKGILDTVAKRNAAWSTVVYNFSGSNNWSNTNGMKDQFMCHTYFAKSKNP